LLPQPNAAVPTEPAFRPTIRVLAGTNGAGKSSIGGEALRAEDVDYFNPDEATQRILKASPGIALEEANSRAWRQGKRLLERAIAENGSFTFETTLGGNTITDLLEKAAERGLDVKIWFVALASPELHLARVRARVAKGGHDIPAAKIHERYDRSRFNLIRLLPCLAALWVYDNSIDADPTIAVPRPLLVLHVEHGTIVEMCPSETLPEWAEPIVAAAIRQFGPPFSVPSVR
jgi:predicted ABC-type ATPase